MNKLLAILYTVMVIAILVTTSSPLLGAPVPGGPGFISVGTNSFRPSPASVQYGFINGRLYNNSASPANFIAPVTLPHGATITQFVLYFVDNDSTNHISAWVGSVDLDASTPTVICLITTTGSSPDPRIEVTNTITNSQVDNQSNYYGVSILMPPGSISQLSGVRIDYTYPINLPVIMK